MALMASFVISFSGYAQCGSISSSPSVPLCVNEPVTFTVQSVLGVTAWSVSTSYNFSFGNTTTFLTTNTSITFEEGFTQNVFVKAHLSLCFGEDAVFAVTVVPPISENTIAASHNEISCSTPLPVTISGSVDTTLVSNYFWQKSYDQITWQNIPLTNSPDYSISTMPDESFYLRRVINPVACDNSFSNELFIESVNPPNGGELIGGGSFCDEDEVALELLNFSGNIASWDYSSNGTTFTPVAGTSGLTSHSPDLEPGTHYFRVRIENEGCDPVYSNVATVIQHAPISNEITSEDQYFCGPEIPLTIEADTASGGGIGPLSILWQKKPVSSDNWQNIPGAQVTPTTLPFTAQLTETTFFRRLASSDNCSFSISNEVGVYISAPTIAGAFTQPSQTYCPGTESLPIELTGFTGEILDWFSAPESNGPWTPLGHSEAIYQPEEYEASAYFRVLVQSGTCDEEYSENYHLQIIQEIQSNHIENSQSLCPGELPSQLTGSLPEGGDGIYTILWEQRTDSTDWIQAEGVNNQLNYIPPAIEETHFYRRKVTSGNCVESFSNELEIIMHTPPKGAMTGGGIVCPGSSAEITVELIGTPPFSITYNDGTETFTIEDILNATHTIQVESSELLTYTLTAVADAYCTTGNHFESSSITVTPMPLPSPISAGMDMYICGLTAHLSGSDINPGFHENYWTNSDGEILATGTDFTFEADQAGMYDLTYNVEIASCDTIFSSSISVIFDTAEIAFAGDDQHICSSTAELNAAPVETGSGHWIVPQGLTLSNQFDPYATISNMSFGESYGLTWIAESIEGICPNDSSTVWVHVDEPSDAGNLTTSASAICAQDNLILSLSGQTGEVNQWIFETSSGTQIINSGQTEVESDEFNTNTSVKVVVQSGTCPADTTNALWIEVAEPTNPGVLSQDQQVCVGVNEGEIELTGNTGEILYWEISEDGFESVQTIESDQTSYTFVNLNQTTSFRTKVQSGECPSAYSNAVTVEVMDQIEVQFDLADEYCSSHEIINLPTLVEDGENGDWAVNGVPQHSFDPSMYGNSEVAITYTNLSSACGGTFTETTYVSEAPIIWTSAQEESCGLTTVVSAGTSAGEGAWQVANGLQLNPMNEESAEISAVDSGTYTLVYTAHNGICSTSETLNVVFHQLPTEAYAGEDQQLEFTPSAQLNASQPIVGAGTWSAEDQDLDFSNIHDPTAKVYNLKPGENTLYWSVSNGNCPVSIAKVVIHVDNLIVPNAFSPNGDHVNDLYKISGLDAIAPVEIKIWNRWGEEVFSSINYQNEWDGRNKNGNELPSDTYYYLIETPVMNDALKGFIVLQR